MFSPKTLHGDFQTGVEPGLLGLYSKVIEANKAQTVLESITHFYCDKCKARKRVREKRHVLKTKGRYVLCEGDFVCGRCGFHLSTYCENCEKVQPVEIELPWMDDPDNGFLGGDILCSKCRLIIGTLFRRKPSRSGRVKYGETKHIEYHA